MGRLIDADKLLEETRRDRDYAEKNGFMDMYHERQALIDRIEAQPTAYDVDKVVEQLGKLKKAEQGRPDDCDEDGCGDGEQIYDGGRSQGRYEAFSKAIEIVKAGGADGN